MSVITELILRNKAIWFVEHIKEHLVRGDRGGVPSKITKDKVGCTICGKDIDEIADNKMKEIERYIRLKGGGTK